MVLLLNYQLQKNNWNIVSYYYKEYADNIDFMRQYSFKEDMARLKVKAWYHRLGTMSNGCVTVHAFLGILWLNTVFSYLEL